MSSATAIELAIQKEQITQDDLTLRLVLFQGLMIIHSTGATKRFCLSPNFYETFLDWVVERVTATGKPMPDKITKALVKKCGKTGVELQVVYLSEGKRYAFIMKRNVPNEFLPAIIGRLCKKLYNPATNAAKIKYIEEMYDCQTVRVPIVKMVG